MPSADAAPPALSPPALALGAAVFAAGAWMLMVLTPNFDNAWLQEAARRVFVQGRPFWTDALEVNPPLVVAVFAPSAWIEHWTGLNADRVYQLLALAAGAAGAMGMAPSLAWALGGAGRGGVAAALAYAVLVFGASTLFGERDSMALLLSLPFVTWWCARLAGRPSPASFASLFAALVAAIGVLLKPTVALVPALLLAAWVFQRRSWRALAEPHFALMLAAAAVYALAVVTVWRDWIAVGELGVKAYWAYTVPLLRVLRAAAPDLLHAALPLLLVAAMPRGDRLRRFLLPLALCAVAFQLSMVLQMKAFVYHALPGRQLASIACAFALAGWLEAKGRPSPSLAVVALAMLGLGYAPLRGGLAVGFPVPQPVVSGQTVAAMRSTDFSRRVAAAAAYGPFVALSTSLLPVWPAVSMNGVVWASRGPCDWLAPAVMQLEERGDAGRREAAPLRETGAGMIAEDLERWKPAVVAVRTERIESPRSPGSLVEFYGGDARLQAAWTSYRLEKAEEGWDWYVRRGSAADRPGSLEF